NLGLAFVADTIAIRETDLRIGNLRTALIEQLAPELELPVSGTLAGRVALDGSLVGSTVPDLALDADVTFDDAATGRSRVAAVGSLSYRNGDLAADNLRVTLSPVQVALAEEFAPALPIGGEVRGTATINGSTAGRLNARF